MVAGFCSSLFYESVLTAFNQRFKAHVGMIRYHLAYFSEFIVNNPYVITRIDLNSQIQFYLELAVVERVATLGRHPCFHLSSALDSAGY